MSRQVIALLAGLCALLSSGAAWAQADPFEWEQPPAEAQLAADETEIPVGKGALFVPSLTGPLNEPPAIIVTEDLLMNVPTGERVLLDPGPYTVIMSSGSPGQGVGVPIDVREGETTLVPVKWGALRVEVTDDRRIPHRGGYEIIRADTREPVVTGFGADTLQGETLPTWVLPPGVYRIVRPGANYRALRDFATVYVPEAGFVRYRLVTDRATGEFRGAGVLLPDEFGSPTSQRTPVFSTLVMGVDGSLVQRSNVVGTFNHVQVSGDVFLDGQVGWNVGAHHFAGLLQLEEGISQIRPQTGDPLPVVKSRDRVRADLLYTYLLRDRIGPYVRAAGETRAFQTAVLATEDVTVIREEADGDLVSEFVRANDTFHVADPFAPSIIREGIGVNTRLLNSRLANLNWRVGFGLRQNLYRGAYLLADDPDTEEIEYTQVESFSQEGVESTIVATLRLPGWVVYQTDLELFSAFETFGEPSIEWRNTLSLRLTRNLSLNYYANVDILPQVVAAPQFEQSLLLRASWQLL